MIQKAFQDDAVSAVQIKVWQNASKMVENLLKVIHVLEGLQQAEHLRMLNVHGLQSTKIDHPGDLALYSPDLVSCDFWLLPKLKPPLKEKRFQSVGEIQENMTGQLIAIGRTV